MNLRRYVSAHPSASILLCHGYAEHVGRYTDLIESLVAAGFDVYAYDLTGHGTSEGPRAQVDVGQLITEHRRVRELVRSEMRTEDLVLFGHSMGGLVTASSAMIDPNGIACVVLSGPAFKLQTSVGQLPAKILYGLARSVPGLGVSKVNPADMSRNPDVIEAFEVDELSYHGKVPALTASSMILHGYKALDHATLWPEIPLLVFHGTKDAITAIEGSAEFVSTVRLAGGSAALIEVDGAYHEVFNEPEAPRLREQMIGWITDQLRVAKLDRSGA